MDISITARHRTLPSGFRQHVEEKMRKVAHIGQRLDRVDVCITHEPNPRRASDCERVEVTVRDGRLIIRAEASSSDVYAALDLAQEKLAERLRRARDKQKRPGTQSLRLLGATAIDPKVPEQEQGDDTADSPIAIRRKEHTAIPMSVEDALGQMELVGHDFFLFVDIETGRPSVVYRRKGWSYGVIGLEQPARSASHDHRLAAQ